MGRNRNYYLAMDEDFDIRVERDPDLTTEEINRMRIKGYLDSIAYSIANLADTLEEINEKLNKKPDGGYVVYGDNLRVVHCDTGTDDCK